MDPALRLALIEADAIHPPRAALEQFIHLHGAPEDWQRGRSKECALYPGFVVKCADPLWIHETKQLAAHLGEHFAKILWIGQRLICQQRVEPSRPDNWTLANFRALGVKDVLNNAGTTPLGKWVLFDGNLVKRPIASKSPVHRHSPAPENLAR